MGFKLGRALKKVTRSVFKSLPGAIMGFQAGGPPGAFIGAFARKVPGLGSLVGLPAPVGAEVPTIQQVTGAAPFQIPSRFMPLPQVEVGDGGVVPVAGGVPAVVGGISRAVASAIIRLGAVLGIKVTLQNLPRVGMRLWRSVTALARRYPGISIITFLTGLGLLADEAAEFLFWGQSKKRRRRRGISGRDIAITRRTLRRLDMFRARIGIRRGVRRGRRIRGGDGAIVVAQQD